MHYREILVPLLLVRTLSYIKKESAARTAAVVEAVAVVRLVRLVATAADVLLLPPPKLEMLPLPCPAGAAVGRWALAQYSQAGPDPSQLSAHVPLQAPPQSNDVQVPKMYGLCRGTIVVVLLLFVLLFPPPAMEGAIEGDSEGTSEGDSELVPFVTFIGFVSFVDPVPELMALQSTLMGELPKPA